MGTTQSLFGTTFTVPADGETEWGEDVRTILLNIMKALDNMATMTTSELPFLVLNPVNSANLADGATLSVTGNRHDVSGNGNVNLGALSTTNLTDGQTLLLVGQDDSNTVEMDSDNDSTTKFVINGDMILGSNDAIFLMWDSAAGKWIEVSRSN